MTAGAQFVADERCGHTVTATELEHAVAGLDVEFLDRPPLALRCPAHGVLPGDRIRPSVACSCHRLEGEPHGGAFTGRCAWSLTPLERAGIWIRPTHDVLTVDVARPGTRERGL
jgi:hypothetical protein